MYWMSNILVRPEEKEDKIHLILEEHSLLHKSKMFQNIEPTNITFINFHTRKNKKLIVVRVLETFSLEIKWATAAQIK